MNATGLSKRQILAQSAERAQARRAASSSETAEATTSPIVVRSSREHAATLRAMGIAGAYTNLADIRAEASAREPKLAPRFRTKPSQPAAFSVDEAALAEDLIKYAQMGDVGAAYHVLNRGKAKADSQLRRGLLGLVVPNSEMPKLVERVALPWGALHQATEIVKDIRDPAARLAGMYFMARAHKVTCDELAARVDSGTERRKINGPSAAHVKLFCKVAAATLRPDDFDDADQRRPFREDNKPRGPYVIGVTGQLRQDFAITHGGKIAKGVDTAFENLQSTQQKAVAALMNPAGNAAAGPA